VTGLRRDVVILACAVSAGIHGALAPEHFGEGAAAGVAFVVATVVLAAIAMALTVAPRPRTGLVAAVATLGGLIGAYVLAVTTGLPVLHPEPEPVESLALATKAIEAVGLVAAWQILARRRPLAAHPSLLKGTP